MLPALSVRKKRAYHNAWIAREKSQARAISPMYIDAMNYANDHIDQVRVSQLRLTLRATLLYGTKLNPPFQFFL